MQSTGVGFQHPSWAAMFYNSGIWAPALVSVVLICLTATWLSLGRSINEPPTMKETIPFISNTYQYMVHQASFMRRVL